MSVKISHTPSVQAFFKETSGLINSEGNPRIKQVVNRLLVDTVKIIEDLEVTTEEFWQAVAYVNQLGARQEAALLVAGLGLEHFLDLLSDAHDEQVGMTGGTPRTIEGPLYVAGAPISEGEARMDDGTDAGTVMFLHGHVFDVNDQPVAGATVDIWHANTKGGYSHFDPSQSEYNLRRRIITDSEGRYRVRSILPSGYGCPADGPTQALLDSLGRHGNRPAHIHFFISAPGCRHLTTQINLAGDKYLWDDFAYATREGLVCDVNFKDEVPGLTGPSADIRFDFQLQPARSASHEVISQRQRVES